MPRRGRLTQAENADGLGIAKNTIEVHCHRIDAKVTDAKRLLELVEGAETGAN
ncbi:MULTISPECIES: hypothetical protein [Halorussus]|uniref:hypothetical protein n=1 Tax=Halorussus TaxID=1070314 RepID=UPI00209F0434|nr:hypothetical protein [Halorussus vallis]USZ74749.1 hypothetical protein NGM07_15060 [Halorussus vallis]